MTPFESSVLSAIRELSLKSRPVSFGSVERRLSRSQSQVHTAVKSLVRYGHVVRKRMLDHGVWMTALIPAERPKPTDKTRTTICPPGYAAGYGWETHPEDPMWRS